MSRIAITAVEQSPAASRPLLEAVNKQLGTVPNLMKVLGNSPAALGGYLGLSGALGKGTLGAKTGERIALVSHGGVLDCLYRHANAMTLTEPRQHELRNASINRLSSDGHQLTVLQWGDVAHLDLLVLDEVDRRVP